MPGCHNVPNKKMLKNTAREVNDKKKYRVHGIGYKVHTYEIENSRKSFDFIGNI